MHEKFISLCLVYYVYQCKRLHEYFTAPNFVKPNTALLRLSKNHEMKRIRRGPCIDHDKGEKVYSQWRLRKLFEACIFKTA